MSNIKKSPEEKTETEEEKEYDFDLCIQDSFNMYKTPNFSKFSPKRAYVTQESFPESIESVEKVLKSINAFKVISIYAELTNG